MNLTHAISQCKKHIKQVKARLKICGSRVDKNLLFELECELEWLKHLKEEQMLNS